MILKHDNPESLAENSHTEEVTEETMQISRAILMPLRRIASRPTVEEAQGADALEVDALERWASIDHSKLSRAAWWKIDFGVSIGWGYARFFSVLAVIALCGFPWVYGIPVSVILAAVVVAHMREIRQIVDRLDDVEVESWNEEEFRMNLIQKAVLNRHRKWAQDILAEHDAAEATDPFKMLNRLAKARKP